MANNKSMRRTVDGVHKPRPIATIVFDKDLTVLKKTGSRKITGPLAAAIIKETAARTAVEKRMRDAGYDLEGDEHYMLMDGHDNAFIGMMDKQLVSH